MKGRSYFPFKSASDSGQGVWYPGQSLEGVALSWKVS
jgi:hypothetical protein